MNTFQYFPSIDEVCSNEPFKIKPFEATYEYAYHLPYFAEIQSSESNYEILNEIVFEQNYNGLYKYIFNDEPRGDWPETNSNKEFQLFLDYLNSMIDAKKHPDIYVDLDAVLSNKPNYAGKLVHYESGKSTSYMLQVIQYQFTCSFDEAIQKVLNIPITNLLLELFPNSHYGLYINLTRTDFIFTIQHINCLIYRKYRKSKIERGENIIKDTPTKPIEISESVVLEGKKIPFEKLIKDNEILNEVSVPADCFGKTIRLRVFNSHTSETYFIDGENNFIGIDLVNIIGPSNKDAFIQQFGEQKWKGYSPEFHSKTNFLKFLKFIDDYLAGDVKLKPNSIEIIPVKKDPLSSCSYLESLSAKEYADEIPIKEGQEEDNIVLLDQIKSLIEIEAPILNFKL